MSRFSVKLFKRIHINLLFFPLAIASILGNYYLVFFASYITALLHELSHIICAKRLKVGISYIEIQPFGICAKLKSDIIKNPFHEILIALSGPLFNITAATALCFLKQQNDLILHIIYLNISMAAINLVPALPLDGGRILRAYLTLKLGAIKAYNLSLKISRIPIVAILSLAVYSLIFRSFNFSLLMIGVFLLGNLFTEQCNITKTTLKEVLLYKEKLSDTELNKASVICASSKTPARKIFKLLSYNRYHIIHIIDDNLQITKTVTEGQIIDEIYKKGIRITLEDI